MKIESLDIPEILLITPERFSDERGSFCETWNARRYAEVGIEGPFLQDNLSRSKFSNTVRGLHIQIGPSAQGKLIQVLSGAIFDVAVDVRRTSRTYGMHVTVELVEQGQQLWVPPGFLHGFMTLMPATEVCYKTTAYYNCDAERGVIWDDPSLGIEWPKVEYKLEVTIAERDRMLPRLTDCEPWFC